MAADVIDGTCDSGAGIAWTDDGYNAVADDSCLGGLAATGDVTGTSSSDVGTLANNGGPTQTIELLAGNPAINLIPYGTAFTVPAGSSTVTVACPVRSDQRGVANAGANGCDAGAVQYATQSASFSAPTSAIVGQAAAALSGSSSSSLPLSYSVDPSTTHSACSVSADKVSFIHAGTCVLDGNQSGDDNYSAAATVQRSLAVSPAQTSTAVTVGSSAVRATVTAAPPGGGTPGGTVRFTTGGQVLGSVALVSGVATLDYTVPANTTEQITASYQGNSDYLGSSGAANGSGVTVASGGGLQYSRAANPSIKAKLHSAEPRNAKGWWRTPVTISFTCKTRGSQLIGGCPKAVTLRQSGKRLSVTRAIRAKNGGRAKVTVSGMAIDLTRPKVAIAGPKPHVSYRISSPAAHCVAHDRVSGVQACRLTHRITNTASGVTITYLARVTSNAGTTSVTSEKVRVSTIALLGAARSDGAYRVIPGATYALEVLSRSKPRYIDAAVAPLAPSGVQDYFVTHGKVLGMTVWRLEVRIEPGLGDYRLWNIGVRVGGTTHTLLLQT